MRTNKKGIRYGIIFLLLLAVGISVCACSGTKNRNGDGTELTAEGAFTLDQQKVTVRQNGDAVQVKVLKDGEPYRGPVSWVPGDAVLVSAYQGNIRGLGVGECTVTAKIPYEDCVYTASCQVTVGTNVSAEMDDITSFSGLGDVDVTLASGLYTDGAAVSVQSVKDSQGQELDILKQADGRYYLENGAENAMKPGYYSVTYQVQLGDAIKEYVRSVRIKKADKYEDLFLLDAIDGTEKMKGLAANMEYLVFKQRDDENPGAYVTYTDDGNTGDMEETGIAQNRSQFEATLKEAVYEGYKKEEDAGYDTVYRMYCRKDNISEQPKPFFYLNLKDTTNPAWANFNTDYFPEQVNLSVWYRVWYRKDSSQKYTRHISTNEWLYLFSSMNDGETSIGGAMPQYKNGGWLNCTLDLGSISDKVRGINSLAIGLEIAGTERGEYILEIYSVELQLPEAVNVAEDGTVDLLLPGVYSGLFDSYSYIVADVDDESNTAIKSGTSDDRRVKLEKGYYKIIYTLKKDGRALKKPYVRELIVN